VARREQESGGRAGRFMGREGEGSHALVVVEHGRKFIHELTTQGKNAAKKKVTVLHEGSVLAEGTLADVQANDKVVEVYLGR